MPYPITVSIEVRVPGGTSFTLFKEVQVDSVPPRSYEIHPELGAIPITSFCASGAFKYRAQLKPEIAHDLSEALATCDILQRELGFTSR